MFHLVKLKVINSWLFETCKLFHLNGFIMNASERVCTLDMDLTFDKSPQCWVPGPCRSSCCLTTQTHILTGVDGVQLLWGTVLVIVVLGLHGTQMLVHLVPEADHDLMMLVAERGWRRRRWRRSRRRRRGRRRGLQRGCGTPLALHRHGGATEDPVALVVERPVDAVAPAADLLLVVLEVLLPQRLQLADHLHVGPEHPPLRQLLGDPAVNHRVLHGACDLVADRLRAPDVQKFFDFVLLPVVHLLSWGKRCSSSVSTYYKDLPCIFAPFTSHFWAGRRRAQRWSTVDDSLRWLKRRLWLILDYIYDAFTLCCEDIMSNYKRK